MARKITAPAAAPAIALIGTWLSADEGGADDADEMKEIDENVDEGAKVLESEFGDVELDVVVELSPSASSTIYHQ